MAEEKKDFVVKDRRIFSEDRSEEKTETASDSPPKASDEAGDKTESVDKEEKPAEEKSEKDAAGAAKEEPEDIQLPEINFPTFIFSLNSSALVHLGVIEDPATGQKAKNLPMAKQTIDILGMIEEKTKGNLTEDEASMLKHILYELRIIYVKEKG